MTRLAGTPERQLKTELAFMDIAILLSTPLTLVAISMLMPAFYERDGTWILGISCYLSGWFLVSTGQSYAWLANLTFLASLVCLLRESQWWAVLVSIFSVALGATGYLMLGQTAIINTSPMSLGFGFYIWLLSLIAPGYIAARRLQTVKSEGTSDQAGTNEGLVDRRKEEGQSQLRFQPVG